MQSLPSEIIGKIINQSITLEDDGDIIEALPVIKCIDEKLYSKVIDAIDPKFEEENRLESMDLSELQIFEKKIMKMGNININNNKKGFRSNKGIFIKYLKNLRKRDTIFGLTKGTCRYIVQEMFENSGENITLTNLIKTVLL
jgi:hypothetical protein